MFRSTPAPIPCEEISRSLEELAASLSVHDSSGALAALASRIPWGRRARALARTDLTGIPVMIAAGVLQLSQRKEVRVFANRIGMEPIAAAIAVLACMTKSKARHAARVFRSIVATVGKGESRRAAQPRSRAGAPLLPLE